MNTNIKQTLLTDELFERYKNWCAGKPLRDAAKKNTLLSTKQIENLKEYERIVDALYSKTFLELQLTLKHTIEIDGE